MSDVVNRTARTLGLGAGVTVAVISTLLAVALKTWFLMLLFGVTYATFDVLLPIGFWESLPLAVLIHFVVAGSNSNGS